MECQDNWSLRVLLHDNQRRFVGFSLMLKELFQQMLKFCTDNQIEYSTLLTAFHYLKVQIAKQLSEPGSFKTMQDLY